MYDRATLTELEQVRAQTVPRDERLCRLLARRLSPTWGFVTYGLLYLFFLPAWGALAGIVGSAYVMKKFVEPPAPSWLVVVILLISAALFGLGWWPFARWVRARRGQGKRLAREGALVAATVTRSTFGRIRGAPYTRAKLEATVEGKTVVISTSVGGHPKELEPGKQVEALIHPELAYAGVFPTGGRMAGAKRH